MAKENESGITAGLAFKRRSVFKTVLIVCGVIVFLFVLTFGGMALFFKDAWNDVRSWVSDGVEVNRVRLFRHIAKALVDGSDLKADDKAHWEKTVDRMAVSMLERRGSDEQRRSLRTYFDKIAEAMKDDELKSAELEPIRPDLDRLLGEIDAHEKAKKG